VFTAFSGSHQDAIRKGFAASRKNGDVKWAVPYLPIDPSDLGRTYEAIIRINSQSGKGGVGYVLETDFGFRLPRDLLIEFSQRVQAQAERSGEEVSPATICALFESEYLDRADDAGPDAFRLDAGALSETDSPKGAVAFTASVSRGGDQRRLSCAGPAAAAALVAALNAETGLDVFVSHESADPLRAPDEGFVAYVELTAGVSSPAFGLARGPSSLVATIVATIRALNHLRALMPGALGRRGGVPVASAS
jgi:2-isopropylmalate synthase